MLVLGYLNALSLYHSLALSLHQPIALSERWMHVPRRMFHSHQSPTFEVKRAILLLLHPLVPAIPDESMVPHPHAEDSE
jgi:hypothetical protein